MVLNLYCNHWFSYYLCYLGTLENEKDRSLYLLCFLCSTQYNLAVIVGNWLVYVLIIPVVGAILLLPHKKNVLMDRVMEERPLCDKTSKPTNDNIKKVLASTFSYYNQLMGSTKAFSKEWNYSKSSGWMQKVFDNKKALFYLIPLTNQFLISMTVRENEREMILTDKEIDFDKEQLRQAKKYSEGYAMRFSVIGKESFSRTLIFIMKIIALRK